MTLGSDTLPATDEHAAVLAVIEALRAYFAARGYRTFRFDLAEDWYHAQLFPPTREQFRRAVRFMHKTTLSGGHLSQPRPVST